MNINESIRQSIQNISAIKKFSQRKMVRFWHKYDWVVFLCGTGMFLGCFIFLLLNDLSESPTNIAMGLIGMTSLFVAIFGTLWAPIVPWSSKW